MVVQYLIDWKDIHARIQRDGADNVKLDYLRKDLRRLRMNVRVNGVLMVDQGKWWIRELFAAINDLRQDDETQSIPSWEYLAKELEAYVKLYDEKRILLANVERGATIEQAVGAIVAFLRDSNVAVYDLPCAVISSNQHDATNGIEWCSIDSYEESDIEGLRSSWTHPSFADDNMAHNAEFDRYMAGLSVAASAYGTVEFYDPYCGCVFFRQARIQTAPIENWDASVRRFLAPFVRNRHISTIRFVCQMGNLYDKNCNLSNIKNTIRIMMSRRGCRRNCPMTVALKVKKEGDFHNRWIDFGIGTCALEGGLEVFARAGNGSLIINKSFPAIVNSDSDRADYKKVHELSQHTFADAQELNRQNRFQCDGVLLEDVVPNDKEDLLELKVYPTIEIHHDF